MREYSKIISNNTFVALKCKYFVHLIKFFFIICYFFFVDKGLKSPRLFQLLLNDDQNTSAIIMNAIRDIIKCKRNLLDQIDEKTLYSFLDELIYKMATCELIETGL